MSEKDYWEIVTRAKNLVKEFSAIPMDDVNSRNQIIIHCLTNEFNIKEELAWKIFINNNNKFELKKIWEEIKKSTL